MARQGKAWALVACGLVLVACAAVGAGQLWAQRAEDVRGRLPGPGEGSEDEIKHRFNSDRRLFNELLQGQTQAAAADPGLVENAAKWYVYRLTWAEYRKPGQMDDLVHEFETHVVGAKPREVNGEFMGLFAHQVIIQLRKILENDIPINRINGARLLAQLAKTGQDEVADLLTEVLEDKPQLDAVKFWALQGMRSLFAMGRPRPEDREGRCIQAAVAYLVNLTSRPVDLPADQADGIRYVRREALRALGQTRLPAAKTGGTATALALLRIVARDRVTPEPSATEQVEAVAGIGNLQAKLSEEYRPDYAAFHIGRFVVEFSRKAQAAASMQRADQKADQIWRVHAARLIRALDSMKSNRSDDEAVAKYLDGIYDQASGPLRSVQTQEPADVSQLDSWLRQNPPPSPSLIKGNSKAIVRTNVGQGG